MKKTLLLAILAGAALAGCVKNEEVAKSSDTSPERITFDAPVVSVPTRAEEIADDYPMDRDFGVYALYHVGNFASYDGCTLYMDNVQCTYNSSFSESEDENATTYQCWVPVEAYYWPKTEKSKLTFGAYAPSTYIQVDDTPDAAGGERKLNSATVTWDEDGFTFANFKVNNDPTKQIDLLYSGRIFNKTVDDNATNVVNGENGNHATPYDGIQIPFKHALSSIVFTARAEIENTVRLKQITVKNIYSKGTFNQGLSFTSSTGEDTETAGWSSYSESKEYDIYKYSGEENAMSTLTDSKDNPMTFKSTNEASGGKRKSDLIVLPQELSKDGRVTGYKLNEGESVQKDAIVTVTYQIKKGSGWSEDQVSEFKLARGTQADPTFNWEMGKRYTYAISIGLNQIYFAPTVAVWTDQDGVLAIK